MAVASHHLNGPEHHIHIPGLGLVGTLIQKAGTALAGLGQSNQSQSDTVVAERLNSFVANPPVYPIEAAPVDTRVSDRLQQYAGRQ